MVRRACRSEVDKELPERGLHLAEGDEAVVTTEVVRYGVEKLQRLVRRAFVPVLPDVQTGQLLSDVGGHEYDHAAVLTMAQG